jgi:O-antigen/teichoic acid export membrane protein
MRPSIQRNLVWLTASQIATWSASLVVVIIMLPRHVSVGDFGTYQFAAAFVGYFALVATMGSTTYLVKTIARDATQAGPLLANALVMKLVATGLLSVVVLALAYVLGYSGRTMLLVEVACVAMVVQVLNEAVGATLQGLERINKFALWRCIQIYVGGAVGLALLLADKGIVAYALVAPLAGLIPLAANTVHMWPELRESLHIDFRVWGKLIRGGSPFLLWSAILLVYGTIDIPILKAMAGDAAVGAYALAYAWVSLPAGFSSVVTTATMPSMSANAVDQSSPEFSRITNRSISLVAFVGIPMSIGTMLVASDIFGLLHYQAGFELAVPLVQILALHIPLVGIDMVLGSALIAADRQKIWTVIAGGAALLNPLLNLIAIPIAISLFNNGAIGAAVITEATEMFMMVGALLVRPKGVMDRPTTSFALRTTVASLAMVPAVLAVSGAVLPVKIGVGVAAYALASVALGTISLSGLRQAFSGRVAPSLLLNSIASPSK